MLEGIFKFWRLPDPNIFDIKRHWYVRLSYHVHVLCSYMNCVTHREGRLRHHLGVRYDSRSGVFDWDYHMKLHELVRNIFMCNVLQGFMCYAFTATVISNREPLRCICVYLHVHVDVCSLTYCMCTLTCHPQFSAGHLVSCFCVSVVCRLYVCP